ncbi:MAG: CPBP family intramembrane glutamic endopeptidase [Candidatus Peregrinibacteria bacterium]
MVHHIHAAKNLFVSFFFGHNRTLPKAPWHVSDVVKMIFLTGLLLFVFSYGFLEMAKWYWGEENTLLWMGEPMHLSGLVVGGMILQIVTEMTLLYCYTHYKYGVTIADFGFRPTPIRSTLVLGVFLFLAVAVGQNVFLGLIDSLPSFLGIPDISFLSSGSGDSSSLSFLIQNKLVPIPFLFVFAGILAPLTEELVFRGFLLPSVMEHLGYVWGVVISSAVFALVHLVFDPMTLLVMFLLGVLLSILYIRTKSLWPGIIFHGINNTIGIYFAIVGLEKLS